MNIGGRLENLFSLLTGTSLALETAFIYRENENAHVEPEGVNASRSGLKLHGDQNVSETERAVRSWLSLPPRVSE